MIGVISKESESPVVNEFFQLFKTPWEFYDSKASYDVVITTTDNIPSINAKLIIIFDSGVTFANSIQTAREGPIDTIFIKSGDMTLPIYGGIQSISDKGHPIITELNNSNVIGVQTVNNEKKLIKIGYDLFREIEFILTNGQPPECGHIPTIEYHISILRKLILDAGIPIMEIPPVPAGFNFIVCLTHDVDFVRIRDHKFDHTMYGFLYRATLGTFFDCLKGKRPWKNLFINFKAVMTLPLVYAGLTKDFWMQFDHYMKIEEDIPSTYFFIPFKYRSGSDPQHRISKKRAAKYDITDIKAEVARLQNHGDEIGLHGIDAWHDHELARDELRRISQIVNKSEIGVRMHWLCFNHDSFDILDKAGFIYDSTYGYNDTIGFKGGTTQAFQPIGTNNIFEIPLHIQDSALYSASRNNLSDSKAWEECKKVIKTTKTYGGVLTILWHQRSIAPERLYKNAYIRLLKYLKNGHIVWFATGLKVVQWFMKRRDFRFENIKWDANSVRINYCDNKTDMGPPLMLRIHHQKYSTKLGSDYKDIPLSGEINETVSLNEN